MNHLSKALETNSTQKFKDEILDLDFAIKQTEKDLRIMRKKYRSRLKDFFEWVKFAKYHRND